MNNETRSWIHPIWPTSPTNKITKLSNVGILQWKCRKWAEFHVWCSLHQKCFHSIKQYSLGNCFPASDRRAKSQTACGISQTTFSGYSMCTCGLLCMSSPLYSFPTDLLSCFDSTLHVSQRTDVSGLWYVSSFYQNNKSCERKQISAQAAGLCFATWCYLHVVVHLGNFFGLGLFTWKMVDVIHEALIHLEKLSSTII